MAYPTVNNCKKTQNKSAQVFAAQTAQLVSFWMPDGTHILNLSSSMASTEIFWHCNNTIVMYSQAVVDGKVEEVAAGL